MMSYYEEQVKERGRKKRIKRTEARVKSTIERYQTRSSWNKGIPRLDETKEKIRLSCLKAEVGTWNKGRNKSEEWAEKISHSKIKYFQTRRTRNKGLPCSQATKEKISQTLIQKYKIGIYKPWSKDMRVKQKQSHQIEEITILPLMS
ncbi:MAG: hypothetical protein ACM3X1_10315 [Ignavibacteriales bacterium]